jgi:zinc/manganese transport system substrate-binding protein
MMALTPELPWVVFKPLNKNDSHYRHMFENLTTVRSPKHTSLILAAALTLAACGTADDLSSEPELTVVATTTILGDVVSNIVGDDAGVIVLMPIGADPHDFRASAAQVASINEADLVVANGLLLEEGLEDVLRTAESDGVNLIEVGPLVDPIPFAVDDDDEHHADEDHGDEPHEGEEHGDEGHADEEHDEHGSDDPHVWLDPLRMAEAARLIAGELAEIAPDIDWQARAAEYGQTLREADAEIGRMLAGIPADSRRLVTNHGSLGYFAERYDFTVIGTVVPAGTSLGDPSSEELATLVETMEQQGVRVIFADTSLPTELADAVAAELGESVSVVELYTGSLGEPGSGAESFVGMLEINAERIAGALGG